MIRLAIALADPERAEAYRRAARRVRELALADRLAESDAVATDDHAMALEAARTGRHLLLENATRVPGSRLAEIAGACRASACCFLPAHEWRFRPSVSAVRDALDTGKLGEPGLLRVHRWEASATAEPLSRLVPELDLAGWFFGGAPREIHAILRDDYAQVHLGFAGGGMALIDHAALPAGSDYYSLSLIGSAGAAYADDHRDLHLLYAGGHPSGLGEVEGVLPLVWQLGEFAGAIGAGRPPSVTPEATLAALELLDGARAAAREGRVARATPGGVYELDD